MTKLNTLALTANQRDIYFDQLRNPEGPHYNIGARIEIRGILVVDQLRKAYDFMVQQHEVLRSVLVQDKEQVAFQVIPNFSKELIYVDYSAAENANAVATEFIEADFRKVFELEINQELHYSYLLKISDDFHIFYSKYHHLLIDGWGTSLLFQRLVLNYNNLLNGADKVDFPFCYEEFVIDDEAYLDSDKYIQDKNYWNERFNVIPANPFPRKNIGQSKVSGRKEWFIPRAYYNKLIDLAKQERVSVLHVMVALVSCYVYLVFDKKEVVIGLPVLNRSTAKFKKTVGMFMGVSPLLIKIEEEANLNVLLSQIKKQLRADYRYHRFPLGQIIKDLGIYGEERLFDINLSYEKHNYSTTFQNTKTSVLPISHRAERNPLSIYIREFDEVQDVRIDFDYHKDFLNEADADYLQALFPLLMDKMLQETEQPIRSIDLLNAQEKNILLKKFSPGKINFSSINHFVHYLEKMVADYGEKVAIRDEHQVYSYQEVWEKTNQIANILNQKIGTKNAPIAVLMDRSADLLLILIGIFKAGKAYIPLDPTFPKNRLSYILKASKSEILITDSVSLEFDDYNGLTLQNSDLLQEYTLSKDWTLPRIDLDDTAYIIYTSGSTGNPKGVEISHGALANFLQSMQIEPGIKSSDTLFAVTTFSFDISILEFFLPLISGATCYIASQSVLRDPLALIDTLDQVKPTVIQATPSFYQMLFNAGWQGEEQLKVLCGGDALSPLLAKRLLDNCGSLWNMYGPTETTIWSGVKRLEASVEANNIGQPIANTTFYILNNRGLLCPIGTAGKLFIGGAGLAKGYFNNVNLTNKKFVYSDIAGALIYDTGDQAYWTKDGEVIFLGRSDNQVKIRGFRIEIGEVENTLLNIEGIDEAIVIAKKEEESNDILVAYLKSANPLHMATVKKQLLSQLPDYMVPAVMVQIEEFPLTPNRKIDRKALAQRAITLQNNSADFVAPQNDLEQKLQKIWEELLGIKNISRTDNFFELGGHSLTVVKLIKRIKEEMSVLLRFRDVFENATLEALADSIQSLDNQYTPIPVVEKNKHYALAPNQLGIWLDSQAPHANIAYNIYAGFRIAGALNISRMATAVKNLFQEQEILRTNFLTVGGTPKQVVKNIDHFSIDILEDSEGLIGYINGPFDLERDLLLRIGVSQNNQELIFVAHHLILDGWSLDLVAKKIIENYQVLSKGNLIQEKSGLQFKDYAAWYNAIDFTAAANFWKEKLSTFSKPNLTVAEQHKLSYQGRKEFFSVPTKIKKLESYNVTNFSFILSALAMVIYNTTKATDFCIGVPVSGRVHLDTQAMIGMMVNTLPHRFIINPNEQFSQLVKRTQQELQEAYGFQNYPYHAILQDLESNNSLFDIMLAVQPTTYNRLEVDDRFSLEKMQIDNGISRLPLTFNYTENENAIEVEAEYDSAYFEKDEILLWIERFKLILNKTTDELGIIESIDLRSSQEKTIESKLINIPFNF